MTPSVHQTHRAAPPRGLALPGGDRAPGASGRSCLLALEAPVSLWSHLSALSEVSPHFPVCPQPSSSQCHSPCIPHLPPATERFPICSSQEITLETSVHWPPFGERSQQPRTRTSLNPSQQRWTSKSLCAAFVFPFCSGISCQDKLSVV